MDALKSIERYDVVADTWSYMGDMPLYRLDGRAVSVGDVHLWFGGRMASTTMVASTNSIWQFTLAQGFFDFVTSAIMPAITIPVVIPYNL